MKTTLWIAFAVLLPCQAALSQRERVPIGGTRPLVPGATVAGPASLGALNLSASPGGGWGTELAWDAVPNATGYHVSRTVTGSGSPAVTVNVVAIRAVALGPGRPGYVAVDPTVLPYTEYSYWVEGLMGPAGTFSAPSPIASVNSGAPVQPSGLSATVGGTKLVVVAGSLASQGAIPGSDVTWTWTPLPNVYAYQVSYRLVATTVAPTVFERATVPTSGLPPVPVPFTWAVPQGRTVEFCVSLWAEPNPDPRSRTAKCLRTQVP